MLTDPEVLLEDGGDRMGLRVKITAEKKEATPAIPAPPIVLQEAVPGASELSLPGPPGPNSGVPKLPGGPPPLGRPLELPLERPPVGKGPLKKFDGTVTVSGQIAYRSDKGAFYILELSIGEIATDQMPAAIDKPVRKVAGEVLRKYLQENPVYVLSDEDTKSKAAKMLLKSVSVQDGKLKVDLCP